MSAQATWMPSTEYGEIHNRAELPESVFAFPRQRKEPLTDASHVRNALARFDQVEGVSDADRELAFANIKKAAAHYGVHRQGEELARPRIAPLSQFPNVKLLREPATSQFPPHLCLPALF
jgi:hypothetical protein